MFTMHISWKRGIIHYVRQNKHNKQRVHAASRLETQNTCPGCFTYTVITCEGFRQTRQRTPVSASGSSHSDLISQIESNYDLQVAYTFCACCSCVAMFAPITFIFITGARCSSVVRAFAQGAMGRRIDPSLGGPIELFLIPASAPRLV